MENSTPEKETDNIEDQIHELEDLKTGDLVGIIDADDSFWRTCREGANCMGIIVHTNCVTAGHGLEVMSLLTSPARKTMFKINSKANIAYLLNLRADILSSNFTICL